MTSASRLDPIKTPLDELKIKLAPLELNELETIRDELLSALREQALPRADLLVRHQQLQKEHDSDASKIAEFEERALAMNGQVNFSVVAIGPHDGRDHFVLRHARPIADCDPEEVQVAVEDVAVLADCLAAELREE